MVRIEALKRWFILSHLWRSRLQVLLFFFCLPYSLNDKRQVDRSKSDRYLDRQLVRIQATLLPLPCKCVNRFYKMVPTSIIQDMARPKTFDLLDEWRCRPNWSLFMSDFVFFRPLARWFCFGVGDGSKVACLVTIHPSGKRKIKTKTKENTSDEDEKKKEGNKFARFIFVVPPSSDATNIRKHQSFCFFSFYVFWFQVSWWSTPKQRPPRSNPEWRSMRHKSKINAHRECWIISWLSIWHPVQCWKVSFCFISSSQ